MEMIINIKSCMGESRLPEMKDAVWGMIRSFPRAVVYVIFLGKCEKGVNDR